MTSYIHSFTLSEIQYEFLVKFLNQQIKNNNLNDPNKVIRLDIKLLDELINRKFPESPLIVVQLSSWTYLYLKNIFTEFTVEKNIKFVYELELPLGEYLSFFEEVRYSEERSYEIVKEFEKMIEKRNQES
jgi:hypothetical protein